MAWDATSGRHVYLRNADVAFRGNTIVHVGANFAGPADRTIEGRGLCVLPGLVNIHAHPATEPAYRGIREEHGVPAMAMTGLYERVQAFHLDEDGRRAGTEAAYCELLLGGVTSILDLSYPCPGWIDTVARSGIRGFVGPGYASARWRLEGEHVLAYDWDEQKGRADFERALALIQEADRHPSGRLSGVVYPAQIDTCSVDLLRDSYAWAVEHKKPITTHAAQSAVEAEEMARRHGATAIAWAHGLGILGPNMILGHAIFIDDNSWVAGNSNSPRRDLGLLVETGTSVAHCPTPFARYGQTLEHFGRYARAGVNLGIGTDCAPHNLLEEMRTAAVVGRISAEDITSLTTAEIFHAATVGGAKALLRDDIGRLAPGAKADLVLIECDHPLMMPARDPLRSLVYTAAERAVRDVYVDGALVVENHAVLTLDRKGALERVAEAQKRMERDVPKHDFRGRSADEISPLTLPVT